LLRGTDSHLLVLVFHHAATDAWSFGVFLRELAALLDAFGRGEDSPLGELAVQYADFAAWQRGWLQGEELERQLAFWREALKGAPATIDLPTDRPRPAVQELAGATLHFNLSPEASAAARALAGEAGATPFMALLAAFTAVLHRWSGDEDLVVGTPVANRPRAELEEMVGFFGNTLPLRADLSGDPSFRALLARVRGATMDAYAHQDVPFEKLVDALGVERSLSHSPLFQVMFTLDAGSAAPGALEENGIGWIAPEMGTSRFDLTVGLYEGWDGGVGFGGWAEYATALFDEGTVERLMGHLDALLRAAGANPDAPVSALPILSEEERTQVVASFNATERAGDEDLTLHAMVAAQAARTPDAPALEFGAERLTYADLEARANRLAHRLIHLGVTPDARVAVCLERSIEMPIAVLAVLKAGGGYVAVDPAYPADRIAYMLEDSRASVVLTTADVAARLPETGTRIVRIDADAEEIARESSASPAVAVDPENLGYVLYTSGSTGKPKGAALPHRALVNVVRWQVARFGDRPVARTLQFASLSFDVSFQEIFSAWAAGGSIVLVDDETRRDAERLLAYLREHRIERLYLPFAALQNLAEVAEGVDAHLPDLREIITAGEALRSTPQLRAFYAANPGLRLDNHYGPSETHVISAHLLAESPDAWPLLPPIGAPVDNVRLYVLDGRMNPAPVGVPGELYAGGANLARGYLARPALTAEKFVPDPFSAAPGARLYRTGDRAKWRTDGELEYIGRTDFQVKLRGFRVEPGEVEAVLGTHPSVREAAAAVRGEGAGKRLVAYVVPVEGSTVATAELKAHVAAHLPEYMVPSAWVTLERMPLTPSGKVDRRSLPEPDPSSADAERVAPRTQAEEVVAGIWERVLGVRPGVHDDFFSLGGHSLRATQVVSRIREAFGIDLPLRALFESPTVEGLAARASAARGGEHHRAPPLVPVAREGRTIPLSFAQQRFWFVEQLGAAPAAYNIPLVMELRGALDAGALRRALEGLVRRHEALRTVFPTVSGQPAQVVLPELRLPLETEDLRHLPEEEREDAARARSDAEARKEFDLARGPLVRAGLVRLGDERHTLLLTLHHIVADAWSMGVIFRELAELYAAEIEGRAADLPPLPVQYADYAVWQRERLDGPALEAELAYWKDRLEGAATLALPTDRPHPAVQSFRGGMQGFELSPETWGALTELARRSGATSFMAILAAFDVLLHRWSGTEDVVVGSPVAGRVPAETEPLIGVFLNTLALRTDLSGDPTFRELLRRVRESTLDAYAHQEVPFERLVEELKIERSLTRHPLFQVIFSMHAGSAGTPELAGLEVMVGEGDTGTTKVDLVLSVVEEGGALRGVFQYAADLWDAETIARMTEHLRVLVEAAAADPDRRVSELPLMPAEER
ncbi:MAG TPA: amino acid adenylation domain-containing protein, partial [Longimicrobium sp.]|nr:amino acid adenylation domain-containing protein [Longimicrobium sp.]